MNSEPVRPRAEKLSNYFKPAVQTGGGDFFRYTDAKKKYYLLADCLDRHGWPVTIPRAMGGQLPVLYSDPIPPFAVANSKPASHDLSGSAGA